jgi:serine/threonine-protein kinase
MEKVDRLGVVLMETYRIERLIAEGSMGSVYEACHVRIPKRYAVKFLRVGLEDNAEALQRFRREAEVVATLEHPNIVGLYDYNVADDGVPFIVFEFLDGNSLSASLVRGRQMPLSEVLPIVRAVGSALTAAHAQDIIHRDLKPENVVLCESGIVKVVDFGVAKMRGAPDLTAVNTIVGTLPYMAPEQLLGGRLDARVDQYALSVIAYEMLSGRMAFDGSGSVTEVARRVLTDQPPEVSAMPPGLNKVLFRAMSRVTEERYPSVAEFVGAFAQAAGTAVATTAPPARRETPKRDTPPRTSPPPAAPPTAAHESETLVPDLGAVPLLDELPPLDGDATRVTVAAGVVDGDTEDLSAPPTTPLPPGVRALRLSEMATAATAVALPALGHTRERDARVELPSMRTLVVERGNANGAVTTADVPARPPPEEPRVTLRTMETKTDPKNWETMPNFERTRNMAAASPMRGPWLVFGVVVAALVVVISVLLLARR